MNASPTTRAVGKHKLSLLQTETIDLLLTELILNFLPHSPIGTLTKVTVNIKLLSISKSALLCDNPLIKLHS